MRTSIKPPVILAAVLATMLAGSGLVRAATSNTTKFDGIARGSGKIDRTIIDISEPNSAHRAAGLMRVQGGSVSVNVTPGTKANQIGLAFRDAINGNPSLTSSGYSAAFDPPSDSSQVKMTRASGSFSVSDCNSVPSVTMYVDGVFVSCGATQGPALSLFGLAALAASLSALAYRERRRRR